MSNNKNVRYQHIQVDVSGNSDQVNKAIKFLHLKEKLKAVALNFHLQKKKQLDARLEQEILKLQRKYDKLAGPLYISSNEIIEGIRSPNEIELNELHFYMNEDDNSLKNLDDLEPIQEYWFRCLKNSDIVAQEIKEKDEPILSHLIKIEYIPVELSENFSLQFYFEKNEYFTNLILKKTFILKDGVNPVKSQGTVVEWLEGKNVTKKTIKKKVNKKGTMGKLNQEIDAESFFNFFKSINLEDKQVQSEKDEVKKQFYNQTKLAERMDSDYDLARMIIDEIIPYSLEYYLGVKINDDYDDIEDLDAVTSEDSVDDSDQKKTPQQKFEVK